MKRLFSIAAIITMLLFPMVAGAQATQTIRGQVNDVASGEPMIGVTIQVDNDCSTATVSDMNGNFVIMKVPVGRHSIKASYVGYEPVVLKEQLLSSGKEMVLNLQMRERVSTLHEIVVRH